MSDTILYNGIRVSRETKLGQELARHEQPNYNPDQNPYPRMLYKATKTEDGRIIVFEQVPEFSRVFIDENQYQRVKADSVAFNNRAVMTVINEQMHKNALSQGWSNTAQEALDKVWAHEHMLQEEAAHSEFLDKGMSEKAKKEKAEYAASTIEQVTHVPEAPKRRGRPRRDAA